MNHEHDQPAHLKVKDESQRLDFSQKRDQLLRSLRSFFRERPPTWPYFLVLRRVPLEVSLPLYDGPEGRFCPAKVYEQLGVE